MRFFPVFVAALLSSAAADAQTVRPQVRNYQNTATATVANYRSAITAAGRMSTAVDADAQSVLSPYLYPLTSPGVYYSAPVSDALSLEQSSSYGESGATAQSQSDGMNYRDALQSEVAQVLVNAYTESPQLMQYSEGQVQAEKVVDATSAAHAKTEDLNAIYSNVKEITDVADVVDDVKVELEAEKPNFWTKSGKFSLQFTQNYLSQNWYKGGNNNVTMLSNLLLEANYNDQKNIQWDNKLDMRLGFMSTTNDDYRKYMTNSDKIQLYSKLGVKAMTYWYYTLSVDANTQFLPGYRSNKPEKYSDFIAPLDVFVSLGMDFKPKLKNNNTFSAVLSPFSYKMRYIGIADDDVNTIHKAYNMGNRDFKQDFGSKVELNAKVSITKDISWRTKFYYFSSYKYTESEWENAFSFQFNKYISSEVYTLWRFDDNRSRDFYDSTLGYFQFKEYFTLGLQYKF